MIKIKIDVTKIEKARLFKGKPRDGKTPMYLDAVLIETKQSNFGDWRDDQTHMIVQDVSKEERDKGVKGPIIGNATDTGKRRTNDKPPAAPAPAETASPIEDDDVPF
jgi:hypothetical protein